MKPLVLLLIPLAVLVISCEKSITMAYDESKNDPILETDMEKSPKENVDTYLATAGVSANNIAIYSSREKNCKCAKNGKDCYCKLGNTGLSSHSCDDSEELCGKTKYIEVEVAATDVETLISIGFDPTGPAE